MSIKPLSQAHIDIVKSTIPLLEAVGPKLTGHFYARLFSHNPELQHIFNMSNQQSGKQSLALFNALAAYAKYIDDLPMLASAVERIANKHASLNIKPDHYPVVGYHLIETLRELAGDVFTVDVEEAWGEAYGLLANVFIQKEESLYDNKSKQKGGWRDARRFRLVEKRIESELVKSLVFEPADGRSVVDYLPGQYIGIQLSIPGREYQEIRQYSLSDRSNGESYRISVKRETVGVLGVVSNFLHDGLRLGDEVSLFSPAGDFYYQESSAPTVLISAGVGITPMQSILETLVERNDASPILYLHACENIEQHSFKRRVMNLCEYAHVEGHTWYRESRRDYKGCKEVGRVHQGYMDMSAIKDRLPLDNGHFYLCGPVSFMRFSKQQLVALGVDASRIFYEVFGPHEVF